MKIIYFLLGFISVVLFQSCHNDEADLFPVDQDEVDIASINEMVNVANQRFLSAGVQLIKEDSSFRLDREGLIDEYIASWEAFNDSRMSRNAFLTCLRAVDPNREQRALLGKAMKAYSERNREFAFAYRQKVYSLRERIENARKDLYESFKAGEIDREEFKRRVTRLKNIYQDAVYEIKRANAERFSRSYLLLLKNIARIIPTDQWEQFVDCVRQ